MFSPLMCVASVAWRVDATLGVTDMVEALHHAIAHAPGMRDMPAHVPNARHPRPGLRQHPRHHQGTCDF